MPLYFGDVVPGTDPVTYGPLHAVPFVHDRTARGVIAHDRWHRISQTYGNLEVSVETDDREHHSTVRAAAAKFVREHLGPDWKICAYVGRENYRNVAGYSAWARRYSVVHIPSS